MDQYFARLESLDNQSLDDATKRLVKKEGACQAALIAHLAEIGQRKLHLDLGYSSLFKYCEMRLGLCEGSVYLRTQVAKVAREFPRVLTLLAEGRFNLTALGKLSPILTPENFEQVIADCEGKRKAEIEAYVAGLAPKKEAKPSINSRRGKKPRLVENDMAAMLASSRTSAHHAGDDDFALTRERAEMKPATAERYNIRFAASRELKEKIERLAEVMGVASVTDHLEEILDQALELALDKKDPIRKERRRVARTEKSEAKTARKLREEQSAPSARMGAAQKQPETQTVPSAQKDERSRYISASVRAHALRAAGYRCEYRSLDGQRCQARKHLEFDHAVPFARGGSNGAANIRVLCAAHNRLKAEEDFGAAFMAKRKGMKVSTVQTDAQVLEGKTSGQVKFFVRIPGG